MRFIDNMMTLQGCALTSQGCALTSQGCALASHGCALTLQGCKLTSQGCALASQGCELTSQGCALASQGCALTSQGCKLASQGCKVTSQGCKVTSQGCAERGAPHNHGAPRDFTRPPPVQSTYPPLQPHAQPVDWPQTVPAPAADRATPPRRAPAQAMIRHSFPAPRQRYS